MTGPAGEKVWAEERGGEGWAEAGCAGLGLGSLLGFYFPFLFYFLLLKLTNTFEFKFKFESKPHSLN